MSNGPASRSRRCSFANGTVAFGVYMRAKHASGPHLPHSLQVLTLSRGRVAEIVSFHDPSAFAAFALPPEHA